MIKKVKFLQLMHDLKRISKGIRLIMKEKSTEKRELIGSLLFDECDRMIEDLTEQKGK